MYCPELEAKGKRKRQTPSNVLWSASTHGLLGVSSVMGAACLDSFGYCRCSIPMFLYVQISAFIYVIRQFSPAVIGLIASEQLQCTGSIPASDIIRRHDVLIAFEQLQCTGSIPASDIIRRHDVHQSDGISPPEVPLIDVRSALQSWCLKHHVSKVF